MSVPNFFVAGILRADELVVAAEAHAMTRAENETVELERRQARGGAPARLRAGERYTNVKIEAIVEGTLRPR